MDWTGCDLVECVPGKVSGQPIVVGTRVMADTFFQAVQYGISPEELQADFPSVSLQQTIALMAFAREHRSAA